MQPIHSYGRISYNSLNETKGNLTKGPSFSERLSSAIGEVNTLQDTANVSTQQVIQGTLGIHEGMLAIQEADISFRLMVQVRNKVVEAYKEIIKMPI
ncbi:MAG: flagellar hook-basal body complex protein FliE [Desulfobacterales bacterium]|nr:flagellar hook-basal body complex protein FliE [Desulfobacterales bacterium]